MINIRHTRCHWEAAGRAKEAGPGLPGPGGSRAEPRPEKRRSPEDKSFGAGLGRREAQRRRKGERAKRAKFWPRGQPPAGKLECRSTDLRPGGCPLAEVSWPAARAYLGLGVAVGGVDEGLAALVAVGPATAGGIPIDAALGEAGRVLAAVGGFAHRGGGRTSRILLSAWRRLWPWRRLPWRRVSRQSRPARRRGSAARRKGRFGSW